MTGVKSLMPTSTVHAIRLALFQPTRRPRDSERTLTTQWGRIRLKARLGQQHADVLEAICYCREKRKDLDDGTIKLLVDPARVRKRARQSGGTGYASNGKASPLQRIIDDLQRAIIEIKEPQHLACQGQILGHIDKAMRADGTQITRHNPLTHGERVMWSVTLGPVLSRLVHADIWVGYDPLPIAALRHGISQAIARHVMTHKTPPRGGWTLDGLIRAVSGGDVGAAVMRDRRRELRSDASALAEIGIIIEGDRLTRVDAGAWSKCAGGVEQSRDSVEQSRDSVEQSRGAWSKVAGLADTVSDTDTGAGG